MGEPFCGEGSPGHLLRQQVAAVPAPARPYLCFHGPGWPAPPQREFSDGGISGTAGRAISGEGCSPRDSRLHPVQPLVLQKRSLRAREVKAVPVSDSGVAPRSPSSLLTGGGLPVASLLACWTLHTLLPATGHPGDQAGDLGPWPPQESGQGVGHFPGPGRTRLGEGTGQGG